MIVIDTIVFETMQGLCFPHRQITRWYPDMNRRILRYVYEKCIYNRYKKSFLINE